MDRHLSDRNILDAFCEEFCVIMQKYCRYIVVSGFLAIASGRTRGTEDIDMIIEKISQDKFTLLFRTLEQNNFVCMQSGSPEEAYAYLQEKLSLRFTKKDQPLPEMEVKFAKDILDDYQLQQRIKIPLTGLNVWFSNVNINVAFKEELLKSPKDLEDARHLRIVFKEMVEEREIKEVKKMIRELRL
ncbi:MAG: hypothetical protein AABX13_02460 [Nanoarchaeota archaeon]